MSSPSLYTVKENREVVEDAMPTVLLCIGYDHLRKAGKIFRPDLVHTLKEASKLPFKGLAPKQSSFCARRTLVDCDILLYAASPDDPKNALQAASHFVIRLEREQKLRPLHEDVIRVAHILIEETQNDAAEDWRINEREVRRMSDKMFDAAIGLGYYTRIVMPTQKVDPMAALRAERALTKARNKRR